MFKQLFVGAVLALTALAATASPPAQAEGAPLESKLITGFAPFAPPAHEILFEDGSSKTLADFPGELVIATFWFTTCPNCHIEMPQLDRLQALLDEQGLDKIRLLPISIDEFVFRETSGEAVQRVRQYYDRKKLSNLPNAVDVQVRNYAGLQPEGTPTSFFIAPTGDVVAVLEGSIVDWTAPESIAYLRSLAGI